MEDQKLDSLQEAIQAARKLSLQRGTNLLIVNYKGGWIIKIPQYKRYYEVGDYKMFYVNEHGLIN